MPDQQIKVGDIVYQTKRGWSGVSMEVVALFKITAVCKGAKGYGLNGLYSQKYQAYVNHYPIANLTHEPDSALGGVK